MKIFAGRLLTCATVIFLLSIAASAASGNGFPMDFCLFKFGQGSPAVLVVGGIQGDEPGGFSAATLLATRYEFTHGTVRVVPNLNFPSIIRRSRGIFGDMNRKFARLDEADPQYSSVRRIQDLIQHPDTKLVLNLHDGSGWYRHEYENKLRNPQRWGQSVIIDQEKMAGGIFMHDLADAAQAVAENINASLAAPHHALHVRNTNTALGDLEMEKSLSWFAVRNGKAAFGLEASKELPVHLRAWYHLRMVENFLARAGVEFKRDFELTPGGVEKALRENLGVAFAGNRVFLPLEDARQNISHLPLPYGGAGKAITSKPIMAVLPCEGRTDLICIHYGNRTITYITPDWREMDDSLDGMKARIDGRDEIAPFGQIIDVAESARIEPAAGYRVNLIGFNSGMGDESGKTVRLDDFERRFSVDRAGLIYRAEVYRGKKFSGMFMLRFAPSRGAKIATANTRK